MFAYCPVGKCRIVQVLGKHAGQEVGIAAVAGPSGTLMCSLSHVLACWCRE